MAIEIVQAGVGKAEITCRENVSLDALLPEKNKKDIPPFLLGQKLEVSDPLFVRALVLDDGKERIVLLTMDVTAIGARSISQDLLWDSADDFLPKLRERLHQTFDICGDNVSVTASHAHGVPRMLCDDDAQLDRAVEAVTQAINSMTPVTIGFGTGHEDTLTFNRTMMMKDGTDYTLRSCNPPPPDELVEALRPVDPQIVILRIDRMDGSPLAIAYNFATHLLLGPPSGKSGQISADHVGVTLTCLEESLGSDVMAFFLQGALGDVAEVSKCDTEYPRSPNEFGTRLSRSILRGYREITPGPAGISVTTRHIQLPLRTDIPAIIAKLKLEQAQLLASLRYTSLNFKGFLPLYLKYALHSNYPAHGAYRYLQADACGNQLFTRQDERNRRAVDKYMDSLAAMERMARNEEKIATLQRHQDVITQLGTFSIDAEIKGMTIGNTVLLINPMELLSEIGLNLKKMSPFEHTCVVSISNGYLHYAPPAGYYPRGGYEVTECILAQEWQHIFEQSASEIFQELYSSKPKVS